eukprot:318281-Pelagomonas_calceolata.AAC.4
MLWRTATSGSGRSLLPDMAQILECWPGSCLASWAMLLAIRLDVAYCVHGCWIDTLNWRGIAGFLLQGLGELTHTSAPLLVHGLD